MANAPTARLETLSDWLQAPVASRKLALRSCLDRIRELEPTIHAWVQVSPRAATDDGSLAEVPFGVKDVIETKGLSTTYGSPIYEGRTGACDAAIVQQIRRQGAVLLGKTQCAAFAYFEPCATRNPRHPEHTPGGSSSGSAAAVAAGMVPFALGTQTLGSVLRPASYCGVTGFKPSYGLFAMDGMLPLAKSLDTLGFFTHSASDMLLLWEALGMPAGKAEEFALAVPDPVPEVETTMATAFHNAVASLRSAGVSIRSVNLAGMLSQLCEQSKIILLYEGARFHRQRYQEYGSRLGQLAGLVREGLDLSRETYDQARRSIANCRAEMAEIYKATPVILVPAATGPAPRGLASTGDPRMNAPWTALGTPAISIPIPIASELPLGLQLTAAPGDDARLLRAAVRLERMLAERYNASPNPGRPARNRPR